MTTTTTKGTFSGTLDECAAWLAGMQPSGSSVDDGHGHEHIEVEGTPGAAGWRRGIEAALARGETHSLECVGWTTGSGGQTADDSYSIDDYAARCGVRLDGLTQAEAIAAKVRLESSPDKFGVAPIMEVRS
jgi:hypothetical protein